MRNSDNSQENTSLVKLLFRARKKKIQLYLEPCSKCQFQPKCSEYEKLFETAMDSFKGLYAIKDNKDIHMVVEHVCKDYVVAPEYEEEVKQEQKEQAENEQKLKTYDTIKHQAQTLHRQNKKLTAANVGQEKEITSLEKERNQLSQKTEQLESQLKELSQEVEELRKKKMVLKVKRGQQILEEKK